MWPRPLAPFGSVAARRAPDPGRILNYTTEVRAEKTIDEIKNYGTCAMTCTNKKPRALRNS